jgi:hypothetical protein
MLRYGFRNEKTTPQSNLGLVVHHPLLGIELKREMDKLGIECVVQYHGAQAGETVQDPPAGGRRSLTAVDFIRKQFAAAQPSRTSP